jgi:hypothetical protein
MTIMSQLTVIPFIWGLYNPYVIINKKLSYFGGNTHY